MRSAAASARATACSREPPTTSTAPARSAPRADDEAALPVDPHLQDAVEAVRHLDALENPRRRDEEARDGAADPGVVTVWYFGRSAHGSVDRPVVERDA